MDLDPLIQAQIDGKSIRASWVMLIDTPEPVRAWTGVGQLLHPPENFDPVGGMCLGLGEIGEMPGFSSMVNASAERREFTLSGVSPRIYALASVDAPEVRGRACKVGLRFFDDDLQALAPTLHIWDGTADLMRTARTSTPEGVKTRMVSLSVGSIMTGRRRPPMQSYTRSQQRGRTADDAFCDLVANMSTDRTFAWPP